MIFVYLDEFGHIGPYFGRTGRKHNESPVFGLAGVVLPESAVRRFATYVLKQKEQTFAHEIEARNIMAAKWEKKGTSFIRPKPLREYVSLRRLVARVIENAASHGGGIFYYGREKIRNREDLNPIGLYTTCLSHTLRRLDQWCAANNETFIVILDQHSSRKELLECAVKTMYGHSPCRTLASPPFEVESYLNQNMQAADWIATLMGRLLAHRVASDEFPDYGYIEKIFGARVQSTAINSTFEKRAKRAGQRASKVDSPFAVLEDLKDQL